MAVDPLYFPFFFFLLKIYENDNGKDKDKDKDKHGCWSALYFSFLSDPQQFELRIGRRKEIWSSKYILYMFKCFDKKERRAQYFFCRRDQMFVLRRTTFNVTVTSSSLFSIQGEHADSGEKFFPIQRFRRTINRLLHTINKIYFVCFIDCHLFQVFAVQGCQKFLRF